MGTKRPFDEDLQEFIKYPKHFENGNKHDSYEEDKNSIEESRNFEISGEAGPKFFHTDVDHEKINDVTDFDKTYQASASLPLVTGISGREDVSGTALTFCSSVFPEFFEFNVPRRQLVHFDDTYSSLLNCSPRKEVPVGPDHQANVPEFDSESARNYVSNPGYDERFMGICVISNQESETVNNQPDCKCLDGGSIRCVQQHVNEARLNVKESLGFETFSNLGFNNMGEEVACNWTEDEQRFQDVVYSNPVSHGKRFWDELSILFPSRKKKELVSYYFNVFILRRRAIQNRSHLLAIDSDDDEWWGTKRGHPGVVLEGENVVVQHFVDHEDDDSEYEEIDGDDDCGVEESQSQSQINGSSLSNMHDAKLTSENEHVNVNKQEGNNGGLRSESYLHWDPPYSSMGSTKGVDLLPTCSMIEEIFGSSKTSTSGLN
ncbi:uncharacterized protein [Rutidosis leptorrhynchoides]|uniref:uncharacterized protein n=1 Tax=Rutidosis leptorrhynchoides TaxID=125765 RepID=UPI003A98EDEB